jgi:hypothetical protein
MSSLWWRSLGGHRPGFGGGEGHRNIDEPRVERPGPTRGIRHRRVSGEAGGQQVSDRVRPAAADGDVCRQAPLRCRRRADPTSPKPPWPCSTPSGSPTTNPFQSQPQPRHRENPELQAKRKLDLHQLHGAQPRHVLTTPRSGIQAFSGTRCVFSSRSPTQGVRNAREIRRCRESREIRLLTPSSFQSFVAGVVAGLFRLDRTEACCPSRAGRAGGTGSTAAGSARYSRKMRAIVAAW